MKASYWTAIGTMLIPIGVVVLIEYQNLKDLAVVLMIAGLLSFIAGWIYTIRYERQQNNDYKQRQKDREYDNKRKEEMPHHNLLIQYEM